MIKIISYKEKSPDLSEGGQYESKSVSLLFQVDSENEFFLDEDTDMLKDMFVSIALSKGIHIKEELNKISLVSGRIYYLVAYSSNKIILSDATSE